MEPIRRIDRSVPRPPVERVPRPRRPRRDDEPEQGADERGGRAHDEDDRRPPEGPGIDVLA